MPEIIAAQCTGCQHVVRVPASLGGRRAKCPKCAGIITIPRPIDSSEGVVPDELLQKVSDEPEEAPAPSRQTRSLPRATQARKTGVRGRTSGSSGRLPVARQAAVPAKAAKNLMLLGAVAGGAALLLVIVLAVVLSRKRAPPPSADIEAPVAEAPRGPRPEEISEREVRERMTGFFRTCNEWDAAKIATYFPSSRSAEVQQYFNEIYERTWVSYSNIRVEKVQAGRETAAIVIVFDRTNRNRDNDKESVDKDVTRHMNWLKQDGVWTLMDGPQK